MRKRVITILCIGLFAGILPIVGSVAVMMFGVAVTEQAVMVTFFIMLCGIVLLICSLLSLLNLFLVSGTKVKGD